jgi:HEAT repeat protein
LSEWARYRSGPGATITESVKAIRHIGTNAVPHLLKWIAYEQPAEYEPPAGKPRNYNPEAARAFDAVNVLRILGPEAAGAAEDLARLVTAPEAATTAGRAARALAHLGEKAFPTLLTALTNAPINVRADVAGEIGTFLHYGGSYGTNTALAASGLIPCLKESNLRLVLLAISAVSEITNAPALVVPALTDLLQDSREHVQSSAAYGLEKFGEKARPAVPALANLLGSPNRDVRVCATQTLRRIEPQALTNAPPR